ncbi:hypothetical protein ACTHAM_001401 [Cellulomonas soli]|uniref:hypothetical protein n=1 Tax=Cellulomonas soli TaxID=931535 RepID=UPI003F87C827
MTRHVLAGIALAALAALTVLLSGLLGPEVQGVALLGAALGGALGLVPDRSPGARVGGFVAGFVAAWLGYGLRAAVLPDSPGGRAVAVLVVVLVCLAIAVGTRGRLPLWSTLLGAAAMAGSYEYPYAADPSGFLTTSPVSATAVLVTAAAGFVATSLLGPVVQQQRTDEALLDDARRQVEAERAGAERAALAPATATATAPAPAPAPATASRQAAAPPATAATPIYRPFDAAPEA